jgi:D-glycero-D-manno-heptose 1,7-bisphosphate phosphatase
MVKALFLDRDGIINIDKGYVFKIEDFCFIDGIIETLKYFQERGYLLIVITNQSGIGRGYYTETEFHTLMEWMKERLDESGVSITSVYFSPYHGKYGLGEYKRDSFCRKPNPGMILAAREEFAIDLDHSILVGDNESDIKAGKNAGVKTNVLLSACVSDLKKTEATFVITNIKDLIKYDLAK